MNISDGMKAIAIFLSQLISKLRKRAKKLTQGSYNSTKREIKANQVTMKNLAKLSRKIE